MVPLTIDWTEQEPGVNEHWQLTPSLSLSLSLYVCVSLYLCVCMRARAQDDSIRQVSPSVFRPRCHVLGEREQPFLSKHYIQLLNVFILHTAKNRSYMNSEYNEKWNTNISIYIESFWLNSFVHVFLNILISDAYWDFLHAITPLSPNNCKAI